MVVRTLRYQIEILTILLCDFWNAFNFPFDSAPWFYSLLKHFKCCKCFNFKFFSFQTIYFGKIALILILSDLCYWYRFRRHWFFFQWKKISLNVVSQMILFMESLFTLLTPPSLPFLFYYMICIVLDILIYFHSRKLS